MKGIKIAATVFMCLSLLCIIETGFAQKLDKKEQATQLQQGAQLVEIIRNCYVPCINTEKLYAVVEKSVIPAEEKTEDTGKKIGVGTGKSTAAATVQKQIVQQTYEYAISPDVEIREKNEEKGLRFNIETVAAVGFITKADIFIMKNEVVKIIILDMQQ